MDKTKSMDNRFCECIVRVKGIFMTKKKQLRVLEAVEQLSPEHRKRIFVANFDALLKITKLKRKDAALEIGLPYKLVRRLVSAGVSRLDARNEDNLEKIVSYFGLGDSSDLWQPFLLEWLINLDYGKAFRKRFCKRLGSFDKVEAKPQMIDASLRKLINQSAKVKTSPSKYSEKVTAILKSSKAKQFGQLIDDYFDLISRERKAA